VTPEIDPVGADRARLPPDLGQPADLVLAGATEVSLGDRQLTPVARPRLAQEGADAVDALPADADRLDIDVLVAAVATRRSAGSDRGGRRGIARSSGSS
jgi:hypothetical protein